jgi:hypothetical protein
LAHAFHLLPHHICAIYTVGIEFHPRRGRIELMKIDLDLKYALPRVGLDLGSTEV